MQKSTNNYKPDSCESCGQTKTYVLGLDRGTIDIVKSICVAIRKKGINCIHPRKEMEVATRSKPDYQYLVTNGQLTSNQINNLSRPRFHGLIASVDDKPGNYCLTNKGLAFLKGQPVPRFAIISKAESKLEGYWHPDEHSVVIGDFKPDTEYWEGCNYEIREGVVVKLESVGKLF